MPVFVHLTSQKNLPAIRRGGIRPPRRGWNSFVYAMPVTRNFYVSHQWLRELKRHGAGTVIGVYFRIPDEEPVEVGHYGSPHVEMTAAQAVALLMAAEKRTPSVAREADEAAKRRRRHGRRPSIPTSPEGFEVLIPRAIDRGEIIRVKALPQVVGWRYRPGANGTPPCACICCERGTFGIGRLRRAVEAAEEAGRPSKITLFGRF